MTKERDSTPPDGTQSTIIQLELRIAEQDRVIADLNEMVVSQWRKLDHLERRLGELRDEFDASARPGPDGSEPPPPHY
ncbi:SlyX family protein [Aestuariivirga sp.]|uniref:SlyX family protein n=1 Tax=Aestuariivirga sp. TaxID=2650926 RepID=UPI003BA89B10